MGRKSEEYFIIIFFLLFLTVNCEDEKIIGKVTYDQKSLIIHNNRELLFSGSVHYPRVPVEEWEDILDKCKEGGLNVIQTYAFWNVHEPIKGKYEFTGQNDIVRFLRLVHERGMFATLRVGPFVQAEWNNGGLPFWLRKESNITFRTENAIFMKLSEKWVTKIVSIMKENKLFASQGGPIVLSQIENEYDHVRGAFKGGAAERYIHWAGRMALAQKTGVPWMMCEQKDAPGEVINACNGRHCGETFDGPNAPNKPYLWAENWSTQYRVFGRDPSQRSGEDIAFAVARWFSKNGSHTNYYMYHGGTNFGRTGAAFATTRYYDEAQLDEYGLRREPKWSHTRDLHYAINLCKKAILTGKYHVEVYSKKLEARYYERQNLCAAFLWNNESHEKKTIKFKGREFTLPPKSISILPDCKTVVFNTDSLVSQHSAREFVRSEKANKKLKWEKTQEGLPTKFDTYSRMPLEQFQHVEDKTDYLWYKTSVELDSVDLPFRKSLKPVIQFFSLGHSLQAFANGKYYGTFHGIHRVQPFFYQTASLLKEGVNEIAVLSSTVGMPDSGSYMEKRWAGLKTCIVFGLGTGELDLTSNGWHHQIGLQGERLQYFTEEGAKNAEWKPAKGSGEYLSWYKTYFDAPDGNDPVVIRMENMTKGMVWVNGRSIGRFWPAFVTKGNKLPSQVEYRIPRSYMKPVDNFLVVFDEDGGNIDTVQIETVTRDVICSMVGEDFPPHVLSWVRDPRDIIIPVEEPRPKATVKCPKDKIISKVDFASFGNARGACGFYMLGNCTAPNSLKVAEQYCLGKESCSVPVDRNLFDKTCPEMQNQKLTIQVRCTFKE
ncbi:unnamed protein product [Amaranthus hypochondriacus]